MIRDFSDETRARLLKEIDSINKKNWSPITDAIGDIGMHLGKHLGFFSLDEDMSNIKAYQRNVLDMTNMKKSELKKIFDDVIDLDKTYSNHIETMNEAENDYNAKLMEMTSYIKPGFSIIDAKSIQNGLEEYNRKISVAETQINNSFNKEVNWATTQMAKKVAKGIFSSLTNFIFDVATFPAKMVKNILTGNAAAMISDSWGIINDVFSVGDNLTATVAFGLGGSISYFTDDAILRSRVLTEVDKHAGNNGLTDVLDDELANNPDDPFVKAIRNTSKTVDTISDACSLYDTGKGFLDDPSKLIDFKAGFTSKVKDIDVYDMAKEYQSNSKMWNDRYKYIAKSSSYLTYKNTKNAFDFFENSLDSNHENGAVANFEKSNKWFKSLDDASKLGNDFVDLVDDLVANDN